ncbi:MAG TPA: lipid-binding SYLF domain-containing protein [Nitrospiraceae bacterium]|nr:lipid-binding SYLF domain-containing protein [Nitrospiraceae bacterium]
MARNPRASSLMRLVVGIILLGATAMPMATPARAAEVAEQQRLVEKARLTLMAFAADPGLKAALREWSPETRALFIVPQFLRGALVFGGAGGSGLLLVRDEKTGNWGDPVFYTIGSASFGLQVGGDVSEIVLLVRTPKGLEEFYRSNFRLGANAGMAIGPVGEGASVHGLAADIIAYARKQGVFGGIAIDGAFVAVADEANEAYYGKPARPTDIAIKQSAYNPQSLDLRNTATTVMK